MTKAMIDQIADEIKDDLEAQTFSATIEVSINDDPEPLLETLAAETETQVYIVPESWNEAAGPGRNRAMDTGEEYGIWLVVAKKLAEDTEGKRATGADQTERQELRYLVEEIRFRLRTNYRLSLAGAKAAVWQRAGLVATSGAWPMQNKAIIRERGLFVSGTYLVYAT